MNFNARLQYIFHSNRLDGIPLSGEITRRILRGEATGDVVGENGRTYPAAVVWSHNEAIDYILSQTAEFAWQLTPDHIREIHRRLMNGVILSNGHYRECLLRIQGLQPFPPEQIPAFLQELCDRTNEGLADPSVDKAKLAWRAHHDLFFAHPFIEGNGRTARLLLNLIRLRANLPAAVVKATDFKAYTRGILEYARKRQLVG